ncbi:MAG: D-cysteine desulfhydrase family protein [Burkholderiales bacterium]|nr:D-cysteine desulfhydrase family protein [Burkholderiales bacterium]
MTLLDQIPVAPVGQYPTPLQELKRLSALIGGARLWVKRDDLTGLAFGGSKTRSLSTLFGRALAEGADTVITCGPTTSNHVRLTAAAANQLGLKVVLVLRGSSCGAGPLQGNMLLNHMLGARLVFAEVDSLADLEPAMEREAHEIQARGGKPFIIPGGGYSPVGALGYVGLMQELMQQTAEAGVGIDGVVFASGSGCIQSGLLLGALVAGVRMPVIGLTINRRVDELEPRIRHDVEAAAALIGLDGHLPAGAVQVLDDYLGPGYAVPSEAGIEAIDLLARMEGLLLDPCYTGKSMAGAMDLAVRRFEPGQNVIFIHTGGTPGIFSYAADLSQQRT